LAGDRKGRVRPDKDFSAPLKFRATIAQLFGITPDEGPATQSPKPAPLAIRRAGVLVTRQAEGDAFAAALVV
jgi:hypothetical protein